jgi:hypothetical protein
MVGVRSLALLAALATAAIAAASCRLTGGGNNAATDTPDAQASPQATAVAAPLATVTPSADPADPAGTTDAGPPPVPLRGDEPIPGDVPAERALAGYSVEAMLRLADLALPPRGGEGNAASLAAEDSQRKATEPRVVVEMAASRLRWVFASGAFPVLPGTELRERADRYGYVLLVPAWAGPPGPTTATYATLAPGTLHALLDDRRLDVGPTLGVEVLGRGDVGKRPVTPPAPSLRRIEVVTGAGRALVDFAHHEGLGDGGILLTRLILDALGVPPSTRMAQTDELPIRVELRVAPRGQIVFEVTSITRRTDLDPSFLATPPALAEYRENPLRPEPSGLLVSPSDLAAFRASSVGGPGPDGAGVSLFNATDRLRYAALDGVPVAWLGPGARINVPAPRGHYLLQWRTFFGDELSAVESIPVPSVRTLGGLDAGVTASAPTPAPVP